MTDVLQIIRGDALNSLGQLPDESVQCVVTSPPYWGLRDYGVAPMVWDPMSKPWSPAECRHEWEAHVQPAADGSLSPEGNSALRAGHQGDLSATMKAKSSEFCECGAWRGQFGLEPTLELYIQHLVQIFREVRRVLRKDGTLWLNLGDSYATGAGSGRSMGGDCFGKQNVVIDSASYPVCQPNRMPIPGLKSKDLVGIPWMAAFALRADGWYLRSDIIWAKKNCMPESVTDRPTRSHEYIFLLSKSHRYFYDHEAIKEPAKESSLQRLGRAVSGNHKMIDGAPGQPPHACHQARENTNRRGHASGEDVPYGEDGKGQQRHGNAIGAENGVNKRSVWTIATQPFSDAHFATFPPELIKPCILAGAPLDGVVLDPFAGSGTTGKVAIELGRKAILIEPKAEYVEMIERRCKTNMGLPLS